MGLLLNLFGRQLSGMSILIYPAYVLITVPLLFVIVFFIRVIACAMRGERALIFDVINHVVLDPDTKEIMFDISIDGTVTDHKTNEILCKFDDQLKKYITNKGTVTTFHELDKAWRMNKSSVDNGGW
jgi:hypothetical protein